MKGFRFQRHNDDDDADDDDDDDGFTATGILSFDGGGFA